MKAVTFERYGPPDVLRLEDVVKPTPAADEVLVCVHATTVTRSDCGLRGAEYLVGRLFTGLLRPKRGRIGIEFAGEIEEIGSGVTEFAVGDRVFGRLGIVRYTKPDILTLADLLARGEYRPVIDRTLPLEDVVDAHRYVDTHEKTGNVVLTIQ